MPLKDEFEKASEDVQQLSEKPSNEILLTLYGLYKQATVGNVNEEKPSEFDFKAIAKYNAWAELKGKTVEEAMKEYIDLVNQLKNS